MTHILDLPPEVLRIVLEQLFLQGYQFDSVARVCRTWRELVSRTVFCGRVQRWVYSERHGCLVVHKASGLTSLVRRQYRLSDGCERVPPRLRVVGKSNLTATEDVVDLT